MANHSFVLAMAAVAAWPAAAQDSLQTVTVTGRSAAERSDRRLRRRAAVARTVRRHGARNGRTDRRRHLQHGRHHAHQHQPERRLQRRGLLEQLQRARLPARRTPELPPRRLADQRRDRAVAGQQVEPRSAARHQWHAGRRERARRLGEPAGQAAQRHAPRGDARLRGAWHLPARARHRRPCRARRRDRLAHQRRTRRARSTAALLARQTPRPGRRHRMAARRRHADRRRDRAQPAVATEPGRFQHAREHGAGCRRDRPAAEPQQPAVVAAGRVQRAHRIAALDAEARRRFDASLRMR